MFTNLEGLSCHTFSYVPSVYERPRWELKVSFHEIMAEGSLTQTDIPLCIMANFPTPVPPVTSSPYHPQFPIDASEMKFAKEIWSSSFPENEDI